MQIGGVYWNDMKYLSDKQLITNRKKYSFFYIPSDQDTFVMLLVHSILGKRYFKPKYQKILSSLEINKEFAFKELKRIFNKKIAKRLLILVKNKKFNKIKLYTVS